ncbi:hypothetical protein BOQ07_28310 [Klebsiella michiganensis]|nr:hypothetical protein A6A30_15195 [Klebsiella michiganensis]OLU13773.1 hypothetical protein BOQ07_28310 [Klebsiella michiganensis]
MHSQVTSQKHSMLSDGFLMRQSQIVTHAALFSAKRAMTTIKYFGFMSKFKFNCSTQIRSFHFKAIPARAKRFL